MLPTLPKQWVLNNKVPFYEGMLVEFKEVAIFSGLFKSKKNISRISGLPKYRDTIIGFLNGIGGYLIMGVKDDGSIVGVKDLTYLEIDRLKLWTDSTFNVLVHKDGQPIDPTKISLKVHIFPVEQSDPSTHIVVIEAINSGEPMNIMTRGGTIVYRLNASNYKITAEPMYRKRDVQGMVQATQKHMQAIIDEQARKIRYLEDMKLDMWTKVVDICNYVLCRYN